MKSKKLQKLILLLAGGLSLPLFLLYKATLRIRIVNKHFLENLRSENKNVVFAFWHENMLLPLFVHRGQGIHVLVSQHFDGEVIARILHKFGLNTIRGSSTRGGKSAYEEMLSRITRSKPFEMAFTPDGPTGPRRAAKFGVVRLARESGVPVLPIAVAVKKCKRINSWDKLLLPVPFTRGVLIYGEPLNFDNKNEIDSLKIASKNLSDTLNDLEKEAEKCLNS